MAKTLTMLVDVEHKKWGTILSYVTFGYNTAMQETMHMAQFKLVYGSSLETIDAMLQTVTDEENVDVTTYLQQIDEARQLTHLHIKTQQATDSHHYNI